ncbi:hypothetical protein [Geobacillus kaustophilus]|uniref:hypothetical protein n=1 Tax=Geobacillus kaustophilus TaxID=1462 RepID=UPI00094B4209|nr:hypothetical protein [Geobacillus kaustophilus]
MSTWNRIESGIKQGLKDVAASYGINWSGAANTASKAGPAVGGGIKGAKNARAEVEMQKSKAETRLEVGRIEKVTVQPLHRKSLRDRVYFCSPCLY